MMRGAQYDYLVVGGGLQSGLIALSLCARRTVPRLAIIEQADRLGGNHTWCFHDADVPPALRAVVAPLVVARWDGYRVRFPGRERRLAAPYSAVSSDRLDVLEGGEEVTARAVIDARGPLLIPALSSSGYQKFLGLELVVGRPHGIT